jgi:hypothetical protein
MYARGIRQTPEEKGDFSDFRYCYGSGFNAKGLRVEKGSSEEYFFVPCSLCLWPSSIL